MEGKKLRRLFAALAALAIVAGVTAAAALASTNLNPAHVGANSTTFQQECKGDEGDFEGVLWHFVLVQTTDVNSGELTAEFQNAGTIGPITYYKASGGVLHWNIITPTDDVLLSASTTADSAKENGLNLSHVCPGDVSGSIAQITTELHKGATDDGDPDVVADGSAVPLGTTMHDSATLTATPDVVDLPVGSSVTFYFYEDGTCDSSFESDPGVSADSEAVDVGGMSTAGGLTLDPHLAQGPLAAGDYSYRAFFASGDTDVVLNATSDCEPFSVDQGTTDTSTAIHLDPSHTVVTAINSGQSVHDSATVTGSSADFVPTGDVTFTFWRGGNDCSSGTPEAAGTVALVNGVADPSSVKGPLTTGLYAFRAEYLGDDNYEGSTSDCEPLQVYNAPLTPGYWKTHLAPISATCSSRQNCSANGPWTSLYLPQSLSGYVVNSTAKATDVWNKMNCSNTGSNSTQNNNAVGCLAGHLLATKLNVANGSNPCIAATIAAADALLSGIPYTGPAGNYSGISISTRNAAIALKTTLDTYNNGGGCP